MNTLYVQTVELQQHIDALLREYPELLDDEELRLDSLVGETDLTNILALVVERILDAEAMEEAIKTRVASLNERKSRFQRQGAALRSLVLRIMERAELSRLPLTEATLSVRAGQIGVKILDDELVPESFMRIKKEPDKTAILDALKAGKIVSGASLSNGTPSLTIRTK